MPLEFEAENPKDGGYAHDLHRGIQRVQENRNPGIDCVVGLYGITDGFPRAGRDAVDMEGQMPASGGGPES